MGEGDWASYHEALSIIQPEPEPRPSFNIKPTQTVHMAYKRDGELTASLARWWLVPSWHKGDPKGWKSTTFNARIETAHEKNTFRNSWKSKRCIIPATGYYEWTGPKGNKQPHYISIEQNVPVFFFAGLYSVINDGEGVIATNTIVTREAPPEIAHLHHRAPVILKSDQLVPWMKCEIGTKEAIDSLGLGHTFKHHEVQKFGIKDDDPEMIMPSTLL